MKRSFAPSLSRQLSRSYTVQSVSRAAAILKAFSSISEVLELRTIAERSNLNKSSAFRILETLVESGLLERVGKHGYRSQMQSICAKRFRLGYASQSNLLPFTSVVTDGLIRAAGPANIELLILNNKFSPQIALRNADRFVAEKVDLVIDSQINLSVADRIAAKFSSANIPFIAVDIPHPGAIYFGADNYRAGKMAGRCLARWNIAHWNNGAKRVIFLEAEVAGPVLNSRLTGMFDGMCEVSPEIKKLPIYRFDTKGGQFEAALDIVRKHLQRGVEKKCLFVL
ncbi:MAG TPA: substrate-binding domain-containing protein [Acidobacteriaceae bacterium]|nr:substrate-binding domain-containing protein [Acidobacteriaceae bacterium]